MKKEIRFTTIRDTCSTCGEEVPEGSSIILQEETTHLYIGLWPNGCSTAHVSIFKDDCKLNKEV